MTLDLTMISWICHQKHRKQKTKQIGPHQNQKLCASKDAVKNMKRQLLGWEKIISDKRRISPM